MMENHFNLFKKRAKRHKRPHEIYAPKYIFKAIVSGVMSMAIVIAIAVLLNKKNLSMTFDLTTNKINSLSNETNTFLASLQKPVQIICVPSATPNDQYCPSTEDLINLYAKNSTRLSNLGTLNLTDKVLLEKVQPSGFEKIILMSDNNKNEIDGEITENKLTNALINLIKTKKTVYFLSGSGEPALEGDASTRNYADTISSLASKAYEVKNWNIAQGPLPADAKVLIAGDNLIPYGPDVEKMLIDFIQHGGKLILIANPYRSQGLDKLYALLNLKQEPVLLTLNKNSPLGKEIAKQNLTRPPVIVSNFNKDSEITKVIAQVYSGQAVLPVDGGQPLQILKPNPSSYQTETSILMSAYEAAPITLTDNQRNKIDLTKPFLLRPDKTFDENKEWPLAVDVKVTHPYATEVVAYGFSLVSPFSKSIPIAAELIPLSVSHLYQDKDLVSIPSRKFAPKQFNLSRHPSVWLPLFAGFLPILTAFAGFFIWMRRRSL